MKKHLAVATILPFLLTAAAMNFLPEQVPMHYNAAGVVDRWGSKWENFLFPVLILLFNLFWLWLMRVFEKKAQREQQEKDRQAAAANARLLGWTALATTALFTVLQAAILLMAYRTAKEQAAAAALDINSVSCVLTGLVMVVLGNLMPKSRRNGAFGLRTVWSMENDVTWAKSNRFGGACIMAVGFASILLGLLVKGLAVTLLMLGLLLTAALVCTLYSHRVWKRYKDLPPEGEEA